jgi:hypothetical protein
MTTVARRRLLTVSVVLAVLMFVAAGHAQNWGCSAYNGGKCAYYSSVPGTPWPSCDCDPVSCPGGGEGPPQFICMAKDCSFIPWTALLCPEGSAGILTQSGCFPADVVYIPCPCDYEWWYCI